MMRTLQSEPLAILFSILALPCFLGAGEGVDGGPAASAPEAGAERLQEVGQQAGEEPEAPASRQPGGRQGAPAGREPRPRPEPGGSLEPGAGQEARQEEQQPGAGQEEQEQEPGAGQEGQEQEPGASQEGQEQEPGAGQEGQEPPNPLERLGIPAGAPGSSSFVFEGITSIGDVDNDLFVWSWLPTLSGTVGDNAFLGGQRVHLEPDARILGDLFVFSQTCRLDGLVAGDVYAFCAELTVGADGAVGGTMYGSSAALSIQGRVGGPLQYHAGALAIEGTVAGDVAVEVGELTVGPGARVEGDLVYESPRAGAIDPGAVITGELRHVVSEDTDDDEDAGDEPAGGPGFWSLAWKTWLFLGSFIVGALLLALGGEAARQPARALARQPAQGLGFGFVVLVVMLAAALLALVLVVTIPAGIITLALYLIALYIARLVTAQWVGDWLLRRLGQADPSAYLALGLGLLIYYLLLAVPFVGFLTWLAAFVAGLGGIFLALRASRGRTAPPARADASLV